MKTFDEKDLITWSNRDKAVIGNEYYFSNISNDIKFKIKNGVIRKLNKISNENYAYPFTDDDDCYFACILPIDAVIEIEPEKKYRACKTVKEFYELVMNELPPLGLKTDDDLIYNLLSRDIHYRNKNTGKEYYSSIVSIAFDDTEGYQIYINSYGYTFDELFRNFEIEINGEWLPFGVEENEN